MLCLVAVVPIDDAVSHQLYRDCFTVSICPAMVNVPLRVPWRPVKGSTEYVTVPLPLPLDPEVIVIQVALLVEVHVQPAPAVTVTLPPPPAPAKDARVGAIDGEQFPPPPEPFGVSRLTVPPRSTT